MTVIASILQSIRDAARLILWPDEECLWIWVIERLEDLPDRARLFFERFMLPRKTTQLVATAQDSGIDVERILREIFYPSLKNTETST
ncbi:MAG: hypothetical protein JRJ15_13150 [Deltaproteobacteria bacterium]|nr:hypothetical protein [Deltaproteobacteria bacterium]